VTSGDNNFETYEENSSVLTPLKWIGCGCLLSILVLGGCSASLIFGGFVWMKNAQPLSEAIEMAKHDAMVQQELGKPMKSAFLPSGEINVNNGAGNADLKIRLKGSKQDGILYVEAIREQGSWHFRELRLVTEESDRDIDLLE
jgi:hypothetical protein